MPRTSKIRLSVDDRTWKIAQYWLESYAARSCGICRSKSRQVAPSSEEATKHAAVGLLAWNRMLDETTTFRCCRSTDSCNSLLEWCTEGVFMLFNHYLHVHVVSLRSSCKGQAGT